MRYVYVVIALAAVLILGEALWLLQPESSEELVRQQKILEKRCLEREEARTKIGRIQQLVERYGPGMDYQSVQVQLAEQIRSLSDAAPGEDVETKELRNRMLVSLKRFQVQEAKQAALEKRLQAANQELDTNATLQLGVVPP